MQILMITVSVTANSSDTGNGGGATDAEYQITVGLDYRLVVQVGVWTVWWYNSRCTDNTLAKI